jgi:hypothetical protein
MIWVLVGAMTLAALVAIGRLFVAADVRRLRKTLRFLAGAAWAIGFAMTVSGKPVIGLTLLGLGAVGLGAVASAPSPCLASGAAQPAPKVMVTAGRPAGVRALRATRTGGAAGAGSAGRA